MKTYPRSRKWRENQTFTVGEWDDPHVMKLFAEMCFAEEANDSAAMWNIGEAIHLRVETYRQEDDLSRVDRQDVLEKIRSQRQQVDGFEFHLISSETEFSKGSYALAELDKGGNWKFWDMNPPFTQLGAKFLADSVENIDNLLRVVDDLKQKNEEERDTRIDFGRQRLDAETTLRLYKSAVKEIEGIAETMKRTDLEWTQVLKIIQDTRFVEEIPF